MVGDMKGARLQTSDWARLAEEAEHVGFPFPSRPQWEVVFMAREDTTDVSPVCCHRLWARAWAAHGARVAWPSPPCAFLRRVGRRLLQKQPTQELVWQYSDEDM